MHDLIEFFCDLDELGAWLLTKTVLAAWYWLFPKKAGGQELEADPLASYVPACLVYSSLDHRRQQGPSTAKQPRFREAVSFAQDDKG